ncbi:MAG: hypothetical protein V3T70_02665, partial [Phycisphaerae bacterium]
QEKSASVVARSEHTIEALTRLGTETEEKLRTGSETLTRQGDALRDEMSRFKNDAADAARTTEETIRSQTTEAVIKIQKHSTAARNECDMIQERIAAVSRQVLNEAKLARQDASQLLSEAQSSSERLREQTDQIIEAAETGSNRIAEHANTLLDETKKSAEAFARQADALLRRSEESAREIGKQVETLRREIREEASKVKHSADAASQESQTSQARGEALMARAEAVQDRTDRLLEAPREVLREASQRTVELKAMSQSLETAIKRLSQVHTVSQHRATELARVDRNASAKLKDLSGQTMRIGQLVGVLRKLHGSMEQRVHDIRDRLGIAESIARSVPSQLSGLREALRDTSATKPSDQRVDPTPRVGAAVRRRKPAALSAKPNQSDEPTLGQIVTKNERLNAWLRNTIEEAAATGEAAEPANQSA